MKNKSKLFGNLNRAYSAKIHLLIITLAVVFAFVTASCFGQSSGGGKVVNSPEELKAYLDSQPANIPGKPIKITMNANEVMIPKIVAVLKDTGKYVSLNFSGNALTTIPEKAFTDCTYWATGFFWLHQPCQRNHTKVQLLRIILALIVLAHSSATCELNTLQEA